MLAVRLPPEIESRLDALAKTTGRTKTFYVREAILEHLDGLEDLYLAERELKAVRARKSRTVSLEKLMKQNRIGDGRIIADIEDKDIRILVVRSGNRREASG